MGTTLEFHLFLKNLFKKKKKINHSTNPTIDFTQVNKAICRIPSHLFSQILLR